MANYLDQTHRREIQALTARFTVKSEWPTWLLLFGVYAGWFGVLLASRWLGLWCSTLLLIPLVTLWLSLQDELLHGHPTRLPFGTPTPYTATVTCCITTTKT